MDAKTGAAVEAPRLGANEDERWQPEKSPAGPVSILMSGADRRALVYRNGVEIGRARRSSSPTRRCWSGRLALR